jgi:hypothetical protein
MTTITPCVIHSSDTEHVPYDEDCEFCAAEQQGRAQVIERMGEENMGIVRSLNMEGVQPDPMAAIMIRIDTLAEVVLGHNGRASAAYETQVQMITRQMLDSITEQVRRARLTQGVNGVGGLHIAKG